MNRLYKKHTFIVSLLGLILLLSSCGPKETLAPFAEPTPIDDQLRKKPLEVSIPIIKGEEIPDIRAEFAQVEELGTFFEEFSGVFADVALEQNPESYQVDPIIYFAPELDQVEDWDKIENINIKNVMLVIEKAEDIELATWSFIKELRIYLDFSLPEEGQMDRRGRGLLLASYDRKEDRENLTDLGRVLKLKMHKIPWVEILKTQRTFVVYTEIIVDAVPKTTFKYGGAMDLSVGLKLGL